RTRRRLQGRSGHRGVAYACDGIGVGVRVSAVEPPVHGRALGLVRHLPVQRLTCARAVVHHAAYGAPPELMPPRLRPTAQRVRAQPQATALLSWCRRRRWAALGAQRPRREPLDEEPVGGMRLAGRGGGGAAPEVAEQTRVLPPRGLDAAGCRAEQRGRRGDRGGELPRVRLDEEAAPVEQGAAHAVAVLKAVAELAECVDVAERRRARAQRSARAEVAVVLAATAAVELDDGQRVERLPVATHRRCRHQRRSRPPAPQAVEPDHAKKVACVEVPGVRAALQEAVGGVGPAFGPDGEAPRRHLGKDNLVLAQLPESLARHDGAGEVGRRAGGRGHISKYGHQQIIRQVLEQVSDGSASTPRRLHGRSPPLPAVHLRRLGRRLMAGVTRAAPRLH
uniref:Uncharacterized protein n=1 Tax=Aegilops tauschii subsp. strangulata TaxID=200361 RepID=A0A453BV24_AEGTS